MAGEQQIILDPEAVAIEGRTELPLEEGGLRVYYEGIEWGDQEVKQYLAEGRFGSVPIDFDWITVTVKIPLVIRGTNEVTFDDWRQKLEAKVAVINQDKGGWLKRILPSGRYGYTDITEAKLHLSASWAAENRDLDREAVLELQRVPYFYGDVIKGEVHEFTGDGEFTMVVKGTMPAIVESLTVTDKSGNDQLAVPWHFRGRHYSSAETAKWAYDAEALTKFDIAEEASLSGSQGTKVVKHPKLSPGWTPVLGLQLKSGSYLTHSGIYDLWTRVYTTSSAAPWLRLVYGPGDIVVPSENAQVQVPGINAFYYVHLGQLNIAEDAERWQGVIQARGESGGENISLDHLLFLCADESSGILKAPLRFSTAQTGFLVRDEFNQAEHTLNEQQLAASGAVSGPRLAGKGEDKTGVGSVAWSNAGNVTAEDGSMASVVLNTSQESHYLFASNFGFALPTGAVVTGIVAQCRCKVQSSEETLTVTDKNVRLVRAGVVQTANRTSGHIWNYHSLTWETVGGVADAWGTEAWTYSDFNAANFGIALNVACGLGINEQAQVDAIRMTLYYNEGSATKWVTSGDAKDLEIISSTHTVKRAEVSDESLIKGRYAIAGSSTYAKVIAQIRTKRAASEAASGEAVRQGAIIRYTNESNWVMGVYDFANTSGSGEEHLRVLKCKAGSVTELLSIVLPIASSNSMWRYIWIEANEQGRISLWAKTSEGGSEELIGVVYDSDLKTGGTLASGKVGFYDAKTGAKANIREYDNFAAWMPVHDAVMFGGLSCSLNSRKPTRQSPDGNGSANVANPGADLPRLPVSGPGEDPVEIALKPSRGEFDVVPDAGLDAFSAQLTYRPCWATIPTS